MGADRDSEPSILGILPAPKPKGWPGFDEDGCSVRKDHVPRNLTTIRKLALGLISRDPAKMTRPPVRFEAKKEESRRDDAYLMSLLSQLNI